MNKLFAHRYGGYVSACGWQFPEDDAGREDLKILAHHYNPVALSRIIKLRAPWAHAEAIIEEVEGNPKRYRAAYLGKLLNFTGNEWRVLKLRTIAPVDLSREMRRYLSGVFANERRRKKRRMQGVKSQTESLSRTQPWLAEGICRRTWERRRAKGQITNRSVATLAAIKLSNAQTKLATSEQGWAGPTYWSQMTREEINEELAIWVFARATPQKPPSPNVRQIAA